MEIIIINGSPRKKGATATILKHMRDYLQKKTDVTVRYFDIDDLNMSPCVGCCYCFKKGSCIIKDDAEKVSDYIKAADGLIIGSPTYESNISGQLKVFIDRGHFVIEQLLKEKHAVGVITNENIGGHSAKRILNNLLAYSGADVSGMLVKKLPFSNRICYSDYEIEKFHKLAENLYDNINNQKLYLLQRLRHYFVFNFGIKRFAVNKGTAYQGARARWKID